MQLANVLQCIIILMKWTVITKCTYRFQGTRAESNENSKTIPVDGLTFWDEQEVIPLLTCRRPTPQHPVYTFLP